MGAVFEVPELCHSDVLGLRRVLLLVVERGGAIGVDRTAQPVMRGSQVCRRLDRTSEVLQRLVHLRKFKHNLEVWLGGCCHSRASA